jgi:uncharacterized protein YbbC (DUF1343 family)
MPPVLSGLDVECANSFKRLKNKRVGILCHQASVNRSLRHVLDLLQAAHIQVTAIFAPEHGLWGTAQDQIPIPQEEYGAQKPFAVYSLYGDNRAPKLEQLEAIDVLVCDLQDVGSRYYTFIWTMALAMQVCAKAGKSFIVLDRPNPLGGLTLEGPVLDLHFASFVGLYATPVQHGMTIGEIAQWINGVNGIGADLAVVPMRGWKRSMTFSETGLPWVGPSPNMPTLDTVAVYPGGCLIEGTMLSEGRGTTRPFELLGAPYIQPETLAVALDKEKLPGVYFRACRFEPTFHKFEKELCGGVQVHITNKNFEPFLTYLILIQTIRRLYPKDFAWRPAPYEYELEKLPFDILCGTDQVRLDLEAGKDLRRVARTWATESTRFRRQRAGFLLY